MTGEVGAVNVMVCVDLIVRVVAAMPEELLESPEYAAVMACVPVLSVVKP
jgi:hypothetical protein